ncbi:EcsC family protein [Actinomadura pelletieri DSM 43383]|uniref:EcsC family protein n=1 Tax=Actinomadura pelletieri DSM 43383 TaxID=1120940 RepID=A0A495QZJ2_9ACTN|nr:EcsC family protein [Actinomadura pelletieri]RKS79487.1 EcsC family protein [Actinomadura pelletieri DSM 43383]
MQDSSDSTSPSDLEEDGQSHAADSPVMDVPSPASDNGSTTASATLRMSPYESRTWAALETHWQRKVDRRRLVPARARAAVEAAGARTKDVMGRAGTAVVEAAPESLKAMGERAAETVLTPVAEGAVRLVDLANDWAVELTNPQKVIDFHRDRGRDVASLEDLRGLDLAELDEVVRNLVLKWRSFGAAEGAALGALALVPVAGGAAAISADIIVMQVLTTAIATRVCYAYGFDATDPELRQVVGRMVARSFAEQLPKASTNHNAHLAAVAAKGRKKWSQKLRDDHKLLAALEKLMKQWNKSSHVPVGKVAKGIPVVSIVTSAGTNAWVMGDVAKQARLYAQTLFLAEKYQLPLPARLAKLAVEADGDGPIEDSEAKQDE